MIYPRVAEVEPLPAYKLSITFKDGKQGVFDCKEILDFGIFRELQDEHYFKKVFVSAGTASWPHGQDISPDTLYMKAVEGATWPLV
jgi:hypothetical protein